MNSIASLPKRKCRRCIVPGCRDKYSVRRRFPRKLEDSFTFSMWLDRINNPKLFSLPKATICEKYYVCDSHFDDEFKIPGYRTLKRGAVPSLFLPNKEDCTEAVFNILDAPIDLPAVATDSLDHQLVDGADLLLNSDSLDLHTVDAQDTFLSTLFPSNKEYTEPPFPCRLPENEGDNNDTDNIELEHNEDEWVEVFFLDEQIDMSDILRLEVEGVEEVGEVEEIEEVEPPIPEKPYFKSVKSYLVDSCSMTEVCRICFRSILDQNMIKLYEEDNIEDANNIRNMLKLVLPDLDLEIYPNSVVCTRCQELLFYSYKLKERWLTTEDKLQKIISKKKGVTNRDADLVLVAKAVEADKNNKDKVDKRENNVEINLSTLRNEVMQKISSHDESVTELEVSDYHGDLHAAEKPNIDHVSESQNICSKKIFSLGKENNVEINLSTLRNKVMQKISSHDESVTELEVSDYHGDLHTENAAAKPNVNHVSENQNICNKKIFSLGKENDVEINTAKLRSKLMQLLSRREDNTTNPETPDYRGDVSNENSSKELHTNLNKNPDVYSAKVLSLEQEDDVQMKPVKVTNKMVQNILSHSDSGATNLEISIHHGDLGIENSPEKCNTNLNIDEDVFSTENDIERTTQVLQDISSHNDNATNLEVSVCHGDLDTESPVEKDNDNNVNNNRSKRNENIWGQGPYICEVCGKIYRWLRSIKCHLKTHTTQPKPKVKREKETMCELCGLLFTNRGVLKMHMQKHSRRTDCSICHKVYKSNRVLQLHIRRRHMGEYENYQCHLCGKKLLYHGSFRQHLLTHSDIKPHPCTICNKRFIVPSRLKKHIQRHNNDMLSCEHCGKAIKYQHTLQKHIRIYHQNEAEFRCDICQRPYWKKVDLMKHKMRIHGCGPGQEQV